MANAEIEEKVGIQAVTPLPLTATASHCGFAIHRICGLDPSEQGFGNDWPWYEVLIRPHGKAFTGSPGQFVDCLYQQRPSQVTDLEVVERVIDWLGLQDLPTRVSINTHPASLAHDAFVNALLRHQRKISDQRHSLCLELVEFGDCHDKLRLIANARKLRAGGVVLALDDFGSRLNCFDLCAAGIVDTLKIDMAVVSQLHRDRNQQAIVKSITTLGNGLGARVVAEGVETSDELNAISALGVDFAQGYHFHKPEIVEI